MSRFKICIVTILKWYSARIISRKKIQQKRHNYMDELFEKKLIKFII